MGWAGVASVPPMSGRCSRFFALAVVLSSAVASADNYDFRIFQLGNPQGCEASTPGCKVETNGAGYTPRANGNFRVFARQFAAAMTSVNLAPPETLGHSGFMFGAELSVIDFGLGDEVQVKNVTESFKGPMLLPSIHVRKGLPFSFEFGARAGWVEKSRMGTATLELKWALNEGFAYLPDIGVRGNITKLINSRDFDLTAGGLDIGVGKQFAIGGMVTLTPYAGWNLVFVGASTSNVDFRPTRTLVEADMPSEQYRDFYVFQSVQAGANSHNRFYGGLRFIGGVLMLAGEVSYSVIGSFTDKTTGETRKVPDVLAFNTSVGFDF